MGCLGRCHKAVTQTRIIAWVVISDIVSIALMITSVTQPWWKVRSTGELYTLMSAPEKEHMDVFFILICIGLVCISLSCLLTVLAWLFMDKLVARIGLSWFSGAFKLGVYRFCNSSSFSLCTYIIFGGFHCRERGESFAMGYWLIFPMEVMFAINTVILMYYPFAPSGSKGIFSWDDVDDEGVDSEGSGGSTNYGATKKSKRAKATEDPGSSEEEESWNWPSSWPWSGDRRSDTDVTVSSGDEEEGDTGGSGPRKQAKKGKRPVQRSPSTSSEESIGWTLPWGTRK